MHGISLNGKILCKAKLIGSGVLLLLGAAAAAINWQPAQASSGWLTRAETQYPTIVGTPLDDCNLCHTNVPSLNLYGSAFAKNSHSFTAIQNLDSDGDGFTNLAEINAHTFPGDRSSHPIVAPTATPVPPTATRTAIPPTATRTPIPPTATRTPAPPTATPLPPTPTHTSLPATATSTVTHAPPTATTTNTLPSPSATMTRAAPTAISTSIAPTATRTRTPAPATKTPRAPAATHPVAFRDVIRRLPGTQTLIGDWQVGNRTVHVTSQTKISRDDDDPVKPGMPAIVRGNSLSDGSVSATSIQVQDDDVGKELHKWIREFGERLRRLKHD